MKVFIDYFGEREINGSVAPLARNEANWKYEEVGSVFTKLNEALVVRTHRNTVPIVGVIAGSGIGKVKKITFSILTSIIN